VIGDEPDPVLAAQAAAVGATAALAGWASPLPDGSIAWALRLVAPREVEPPPAPPPAPEGFAAGAAPGARSDGPAGAAPRPATSPGAAAGPATPPAVPPAPVFRTLDRAGGVSRDGTALARDLATAAVQLLAGPPASAPRGQRTAGDLARRLRARAGFFDACLAERLPAVPDLAGVALVRIAVGPRGEVRDVHLAGSSFRDPAVETCLLDAAAQIDFPAGVGGTSELEARVIWPRPMAPRAE
jgi:hypothetical protein